MENVTAILGITIVGFTLAVTGLAFSMAGEGPRMQDAITVLNIVFGLAGVVVGYYFGLMPGDKRAGTATEAMHVATDGMHVATDAMHVAIQDRTDIIKQVGDIRHDMQRGMDEAGLDLSMVQDPNFTLGRVTPEQCEQIKKIITDAYRGISKMTETPLPSAPSD
jgi:hypothetical protein